MTQYQTLPFLEAMNNRAKNSDDLSVNFLLVATMAVAWCKSGCRKHKATSFQTRVIQQ